MQATLIKPRFSNIFIDPSSLDILLTHLVQEEEATNNLFQVYEI